jgi:hypothetical protein
MGEFHIRMTTTTKKFNTFISRPLQDCSLSDVPGVGKSSLEKLFASNIDTPEKLMGIFLVSGSDPTKMKHWLVSSCLIRAKEGNTISEALYRKMQNSMLC